MHGEQAEELVIEGREAILLREQSMDYDGADRLVLYPQRDADDRLPEACSAMIGRSGRHHIAGLHRFADRPVSQRHERKIRHFPAFGRDRTETEASPYFVVTDGAAAMLQGAVHERIAGPSS